MTECLNSHCKKKYRINITIGNLSIEILFVNVYFYYISESSLKYAIIIYSTIIIVLNLKFMFC